MTISIDQLLEREMVFFLSKSSRGRSRMDGDIVNCSADEEVDAEPCVND